MASGAELPECSSCSPLAPTRTLLGTNKPREQQQRQRRQPSGSTGPGSSRHQEAPPGPPGPSSETNGDSSDLSDSITKSAVTSSPDTTSSSITPTRTDSMSDDTGFPLDPTDEKDEVSSTVSNLSDLTGISMLSDDGEGSSGCGNAASWVHKQISNGTDPREVLRLLFSDPTQIPEQVGDFTLWRIVINMMSEPPKRQKLPYINTVADVVDLIKKSKNIIVLTGAGVSVSCGIPDFRSRDGIYSRLAQDFPDLPDPQAMFDINYFSHDPRPFYKFAREIYPGLFKPSPCHYFIKMLEKQKKLLRNYSQNIDTLERVAGISRVIECHGSFATASCTKCKYQVPSDFIKKDIFAQTIPMCPKCQEKSLPSLGESSRENYKNLVSQGVMKPDIVFFGEGLPDAFHDAMASDKEICDLLIVIGSSLKVRPVALIPSSIPSHVPQVLINRESLSHLDFDVELLGDGDVVINHLCHALSGSFKEVCWQDIVFQETTKLLPPEFPIDDSWDQSEDTLMNPDSTQDSIRDAQSHFVDVPSTNKEPNLNTEAHIRDNLDDRPWKKMKTGISEYFPNDNISSGSSLKDNLDKKGNTSNSKSDNNNKVLVESTSHKESSSNGGNAGDDKPWIKPSNTRIKATEFNSKLIENSESTFKLIEERIGSGRRIVNVDFDNTQDVNNISDSELLSDKASTGESPSSSEESSSRTMDETYSSEECHVVPGISDLGEDSTLEANTDLSKSPDINGDMKPRHASIDSVMDSALGDSCSSTECPKRKNTEKCGEESSKYHKPTCQSWHSDRDSLASRLPENTYYQLKPGKYIFPGAEVYSNFNWCESLLQFGSMRSASSSRPHRDH